MIGLYIVKSKDTFMRKGINLTVHKSESQAAQIRKYN